METRIQIGDEVLLVVDISADWYISGAGYDGESVDITLRRKADRYKDWWRLVDPPQTDDIVIRSNLEPFRVADTPQTDLLVKTPHKSRESHEKNCEICRDKDAYDEWQGNCDECENGSMYTPYTERNE